MQTVELIKIYLITKSTFHSNKLKLSDGIFLLVLFSIALFRSIHCCWRRYGLSATCNNIPEENPHREKENCCEREQPIAVDLKKKEIVEKTTKRTIVQYYLTIESTTENVTASIDAGIDRLIMPSSESSLNDCHVNTSTMK